MSVKTGDKISFDELGVQIIVTAGGDADVVAEPADDRELQVGKRYLCEETGTQVLVVKPGAAVLRCGGNEMALQEPKSAKAAD